jgi:hypothetical protein
MGKNQDPGSGMKKNIPDPQHWDPGGPKTYPDPDPQAVLNTGYLIFFYFSN